MLVTDPHSGAAAVTLPSGRVTLRWPTVGEWADISDRYLTAETRLSEQDDDKRGRWRREHSPYAAAFAFLVSTLAGVAELDPRRLPVWCDDPTLYLTLRDLWSTARITEGATGPLPAPDPPPAPVVIPDPDSED